MDKLANLLDQRNHLYNIKRPMPTKKETPAYYRHPYHIKNKLSIDPDYSFTNDIIQTPNTTKRRQSNNQADNSKRFQTIEVNSYNPSVRHSIVSPIHEAYSPATTFIPNYDPNTPTRARREDIFLLPTIKKGESKKIRPKVFHSVDYDSERTTPQEKANASVTINRPPTAAKKSIVESVKRDDGISTPPKKRSCKEPEEGPRQSRDLRAKTTTKKDEGLKRLSQSLNIDESTRDSYTTLTSVMDSRKDFSMLFDDSWADDFGNPDKIIKNVVERHVENAYRRIDLIKKNFQLKRSKYLFQINGKKH